MAKKLDPKVAEAIMLKAGYKPLEPYQTALTKWKCLHVSCGQMVFVKYNSIQQGKGGCTPCGLKLSAASRTFTEGKAVAIMMSKNLKPLEVYRGTMESWKSQCMQCGKVIYPALASIQRGISGCAYCSKKRVDAEDAVAIMLRGGFTPIEPYKSALDQWKCKCLKCGRESSPQYNNVRRGATCVFCADRKVDVANTIKFMLEANLEPLEPYGGNKVPWKCKCLKCLRIVYPRWNDVQKGHTGCVFCAPKGINLLSPSYLYLITNDVLGAHKVGIGNHKKVNDRLGRFTKLGWQAHKVWETETGKRALEIESAVFKILREDLKLPIYLSNEEMPKTQGSSETVDSEAITLLQLEKIIDRVIKEIGNE